MGYTLETMREDHAAGMLAVFNHYVEHSLAVYNEKPLEEDRAWQLQMLAGGHPSYVVLDDGGAVVGFGFLQDYDLASTFERTAEVSYLIRPDFCGRGIGSELLGLLERDAREHGIAVLLANISGRNERSVAFHKRHGFVECGRFRDVGVKCGVMFDVVWMQKKLD